MEHVRVEGDAYARALQQAKHFGPQLMSAASEAMARLHVMPRILPRGLRPAFANAVVGVVGWLYFKRHGATLRSYGGGKFYRGLEGLAEGFQASTSRLYGHAAFEIEASRFNFTLGCTSLPFSAEATANGRPLLAYNHDFPAPFGAFPFVRESVPNGGIASVSVSYPSMLGAICGVNASGLGVSLNHAWVRRLWSGEALPISMLVQDVLDTCSNVEQAIALVQAQKVANGSMMTVLDARGGRVVLELTPEGAFVRRSKAPVLHTFNAYQTAEARRLEVPIGAIGKGTVDGMDIHGSNLARQARFDALGAGEKRGWTSADVDALMSDHGPLGEASVNTVCRHPDLAAETLLTARIDPVEQTLTIGLGHACTAQFTEHRVPASLRAAA
jgi:hypothetical protein